MTGEGCRVLMPLPLLVAQKHDSDFQQVRPSRVDYGMTRTISPEFVEELVPTTSGLRNMRKRSCYSRTDDARAVVSAVFLLKNIRCWSPQPRRDNAMLTNGAVRPGKWWWCAATPGPALGVSAASRDRCACNSKFRLAPRVSNKNAMEVTNCRIWRNGAGETLSHPQHERRGNYTIHPFSAICSFNLSVRSARRRLRGWVFFPL
mgnify:FL=1